MDFIFTFELGSPASIAAAAAALGITIEEITTEDMVILETESGENFESN